MKDLDGAVLIFFSFLLMDSSESQAVRVGWEETTQDKCLKTASNLYFNLADNLVIHTIEVVSPALMEHSVFLATSCGII